MKLNACECTELDVVMLFGLRNKQCPRFEQGSGHQGCAGTAEVSVTDEGGAADVVICTQESLSRTIAFPGLSQRSVSSNPGRTTAPGT